MNNNQSFEIIKSQLTQKNILNHISSKFSGDLEAAYKFRDTLISIVVNNPKLCTCSAQSILKAALEAINLKLSINPKLGYVYVVPYGDNAQLQIGWKGIVQLAIRSGFYITVNSAICYEGMIKSHNFITGEYEIGEKKSDKIEGYIAYFELNNGFRKFYYMSIDQMKQHAEKYSKSYQYDLKNNKKTSVWSTDFDIMAQKTVLRLLISKFGPLSTEMERVIIANHNQTEDFEIDETDSEKPEIEIVNDLNDGSVKSMLENARKEICK